MMAKEASRTYISHGLFELELFVGAGFFSGLVGSGILFKPLKAFGELKLRHISECVKLTFRIVRETTVVAGLARVQYWTRFSEVLRLRLQKPDANSSFRLFCYYALTEKDGQALRLRFSSDGPKISVISVEAGAYCDGCNDSADFNSQGWTPIGDIFVEPNSQCCHSRLDRQHWTSGVGRNFQM